MMRTRWSAGGLVGFVAILVASAALAGDGKPACLAETQRWCPMVPVGLVQACLQAHQRELSAECRKRLGQVNQNIDRLGRDCQSDVNRFCTQPQTAAGQRVVCLEAHREQLSPGCRKALDATSTE